MPVVLHPFRLKNPRAPITETAFPAPCLFTNTESKIIDDILSAAHKNGLTSHQAMNLFERLGGIIEMG